ncbi:MAG: PglZ domain-containing protein [Chloroflexota bacterium]|nr:PglZ domain-containing protein [Chloroflexota bacterium]
MGVVKDHLRGLVERQVGEHGIVVWFDPDGHYAAFVRELALTDARVETYDGSFFALRHRLDPLLDLAAEAPPRLVVYVPVGHDRACEALIELTHAGVVMRPGRSSPLLNTRLAVVAKAALRPLLGKPELAEIEKQIDANRLTLEDVDKLGGADGTTGGLISVIFDTTNPREVALAFLDGDRFDNEIAKRHAVSEVAAFLGRAFGVDLPATADCLNLRSSLARHVLMTEFVGSLRGPLPAQLSSVKIAADQDARDACVNLVREWRNRRDLRESYADHADRVEQELQVSTLGLGWEQARGCETFAAVETLLQAAVEDRAMRSAEGDPAPRDAVEGRLRGFWSSWPERYPAVQPRWQIDQAALDLLGAAEIIERDLKTMTSGPEAILRRYGEGADGQEPWCLLDTHHRHLERRAEGFDVGSGHESLEKLLAHARRRYREVGEALSERYLRLLAQANFHAPGFRRQTETYAACVAPALREGKTAYVLVDALRHEMACELARSMPADYEVSVDLALGTVPTITPVGMAACLPGAEDRVRVVPAAAGKLALEVDGTVLKSREDRVQWLSERATIPSTGELAKVYETKLETLLRPSRAVQTGIKQADLILVTSQEIDELAESGNVAMARRIMDDTLVQLQRAVRKLADLGCATIVLTADHGHLFADELDTDTKIDPPGGETALLHRRVWVGKGGASSPACLRAALAALGVGEDLDVAVPWGFGGFKAAGSATGYFHGGMSPQEMAIPVLVVTAKAGAAAPASDVRWGIKLGSKKITTRFVSVEVAGAATGLFAPSLPRVRIEVRIDGQPVSEPVSASYGFNEGTRDVELAFDPEERAVRTNTVTLMIGSGPSRGKASVHLLDSSTGLELASLGDIGVDIAL